MSSRLGYPFDHMPIWDALQYFNAPFHQDIPIAAAATKTVLIADPNRYWFSITGVDVPGVIYFPVGLSGPGTGAPSYIPDANTQEFRVTWWEWGPLVTLQWQATNGSPGAVTPCVLSQSIVKWPVIDTKVPRAITVPPCPKFTLPTPNGALS